MIDIMPKLALIINPTILAMVLAYSLNVVHQKIRSPYHRDIVMGLIMSAAVALAMAYPFEIGSGVIIDLRSLIIGLSAAFFGIIGGGIALAVGLAVRIWIGGSGMYAGLVGMTISAGMGIAWARYINPRSVPNVVKWLALSLMISMHLGAVVLIPVQFQSMFLTTVAPYIVIFNLFGTLLIAMLINRENIQFQKGIDLKAAATTDPLTQLLNRRSAISAFNSFPVPTDADHGTAMICLDIDKFKSVNDREGHPFGDVVLQSITSRIAACLRPNDRFSRIGGDEFLIMLPEITIEDANIVAERCRAVVAATAIENAGKSVNVTISIGVNWLKEQSAFDTVHLGADKALYRAKALGRDCVAFYGSELINANRNPPIAQVAT